MMSNNVNRNCEIRERMKQYTMSCRVPLYQIGLEAGISEKVSRYLVSRFLNGKNLNESTLDMIETYLVGIGY